MAEQKLTVRDIMIDVFEFPHVPYWFTLRQVSGILKKSLSGGKCLRPMVILVFDEKYNLVGHLSTKRVLRELGGALFPSEGVSILSRIEPGAAMPEEINALSEKPASALMSQAGTFIDPDEPFDKAAELMLRNDMEVLPVLENKKKLVGIVRQLEVFTELTRIAFRS